MHGLQKECLQQVQQYTTRGATVQNISKHIGQLSSSSSIDTTDTLVCASSNNPKLSGGGGALGSGLGGGLGCCTLRCGGFRLGAGLSHCVNSGRGGIGGELRVGRS
mmetsp:Transcript_25046/g.40642  ORF Transcript_25046/g.40642 Transcript_25046/m.40642 type:complete len:106 (+) Transcript_25046:1051-1368(+)